MVVTAPQVSEIRRLRDGQLRPPEIAELVGVSPRTVVEVLAGRMTGRPMTARERFEADAASGWAAACMDAEEWAEWRRRNPVSGIPEGDQVGRPCEECPLGWAADMRAAGRCNGTPGGVKEDATSDIEEGPDMDQIPAIGPAQRRVDVELAAPCGTCVHAGICRIQPTLEQLRRAAVSLPVIDDAVTVSLAAQVACSHYVKAKGAKVSSDEDKPKRQMSEAGRAAIAAAAQARRARERAERELVAS